MKLDPSQIATFHREGYLVVEDLFADDDLQPVIDEITGVIDQHAPELVAAGVLSRTYEEEGFDSRLARITSETDQLYWSIVNGKLCGPGVFALITNPKLVELAESLIGPEIIASSVYRLRPKVPGFWHGVVPWHQDSGYFEPYCDRALVLTVWIPLVDATPDRGCLRVMPGVHREGIYRHHQRRDVGYLEITKPDLPAGEMVTVPVRKGGVLLLTNRTPHCSTDNVTDVVRWSADVRYQSADLPTNFVSDQGEVWREPADPQEPPACYPPEADFLVSSISRPGDVVTDWRRFRDIREKHVTKPVTARWSGIDGNGPPKRGRYGGEE